MAALTHAKVSLVVDGADPTQVQPSDWNDDHQLTGGSNGQLVVVDTSAPSRIGLVSSPLVASLLFGTMAAPASPSNGEVWVEASGTSPSRVLALKVRDGGTTYTLLSITV